MKRDNSPNQMFGGQKDYKNAFWGIANQLTNVFVQGILIIFASTLLDTRELNIWLLLLSFYALLSALPLSLEPIILRRLQGIELNEHEFNNFKVVPTSIRFNQKKFEKLPHHLLVKSFHKIALSIGILSAFSYFFLGLVYLSLSHKLNSFSILISILCMCVSIFALGPSAYYRSRLKTFNNGHLISQVQIVSRLAILLVLILLSGLSFGVLNFTIGFSFGWLLEMIILRFLVHKVTFNVAKENKMSNSKGMKISWRAIKGIYKQNLIIALSSFMMLRGTSLIAGFTLGDLMLSKFLMTQQLLSVLSNISAEFIRQGAPKFNFLQIQKDRSLIKRFYRHILIMTLILYTIGSSFLISYSAWNSQDFIPAKILSGFALYAMIIAGALELNTICATTYFASKNQVLHANSYLFSSLLTTCSVFITAPIFGLYSLILIPIIIQISYNHWKWPLDALRDLKSIIT